MKKKKFIWINQVRGQINKSPSQKQKKILAILKKDLPQWAYPHELWWEENQEGRS